MHWTLMTAACFDAGKQVSVGVFLDLLRRPFDGLDYLYHCTLAFVSLGPCKTTGGARKEGYDIRDGGLRYLCALRCLYDKASWFKQMKIKFCSNIYMLRCLKAGINFQ